mmetsp:Transcript_16538/g.45692  ORF Transcript_16538/g.45692 Transcript_16538/m.45692 type:complete len:229 (+) Transcript_16538:139-825(+)
MAHAVAPELLPFLRGSADERDGLMCVRIESGRRHPALDVLIDALGAASARAQGLANPVTSANKFRLSDDRLYLALHDPRRQASSPVDDGFHETEGSTQEIVGLLKVGEKDLFHWTRDGMILELRRQRCVLDFYISECFQRQGLGRKLFEVMMAHEACSASHMAYDRPSPKLLGFLRRHYSLTQYVPQQNQFVVFDDLIAQIPSPTRTPYASVAMRPLTARAAPPTVRP